MLNRVAHLGKKSYLGPSSINLDNAALGKISRLYQVKCRTRYQWGNILYLDIQRETFIGYQGRTALFGVISNVSHYGALG